MNHWACQLEEAAKESLTIKRVPEVSKELQSTGKVEYPCISLAIAPYFQVNRCFQWVIWCHNKIQWSLLLKRNWKMRTMIRTWISVCSPKSSRDVKVIQKSAVPKKTRQNMIRQREYGELGFTLLEEYVTRGFGKWPWIGIKLTSTYEHRIYELLAWKIFFWK